MKEIIRRHGVRAGLIMVVLSWINFFATMSSGPVVAQIGSIAVVIGCLLYGLKAVPRMRQADGGAITFWKAFFTGALTSMVSAVFMLISTILFMFIMRSSYERWSSGGSENAVVMHPVEQGIIMFLIVLVLGSLLSLGAALIYQRREVG